MAVSRRTPMHNPYHLVGVTLDWVDTCKYLGVTLSGDMKWASHVTACAKKANSRLGFLRRNLKNSPRELRRVAYISLVRTLMEYSAAVWDPHLVKDIRLLESVQRRAVRWVMHDYSFRASVTAMQKELGLANLDQR